MERNGKEVVSVSAKENKKRLCDNNYITSEILSRLPVKSLLRFKCVSKRWQSIIQRDKFFMDQHFSRSKATRNCSLLHVGAQRANHRIRLLSLELFVSSEDDVRVQVRNKREWKPRFRHQPVIHICSLDGLICLMNKENNNVRICNVSTRESTPWIESLIDEQPELMTSVFGYDHTTKEYKVLALWKLSDYGFVCEVLTVGRNSWRRIPLISISPYHVSSVYVNGSIYLLCSEVWNRDISKAYVHFKIAEFIVHTEKFRIVETTSYSAHMMDLDGRLCLLAYDAQDQTRRTIKMRALYDHGEDVQDEKSTTTPSISSDTSSSNFVWVHAGTLSLPYDTKLDSIRHIPRTNLFIIKSISNRRLYKESYRLYIWNYKSREIITDISSLSVYETDKKENFGFNTFTPNLSLVN